MHFFRKNQAGAPSKLQWFIGLNLSSSARKLECAALGVDALRPNASVVLQKSVSFDIPDEISTTYLSVRRELTLDYEKIHPVDASTGQPVVEPAGGRASKPQTSPSTLAKTILLRNMIASIQEEALNEILSDDAIPRAEILAVALNDPGFWLKSFDSEKQFSFLPISDAGLLAERSGLNVIDSFYAKDWTPTRSGNPFLLLPYWLLLNGGDRDKVVVDLGERARWHYIPCGVKDKESWRRAFTVETSPCGSLLNLFARESSKGRSFIDVGGKLTVQGRRSQELLVYWQEFASTFKTSRNFSKYSPLASIPNENDLFDSVNRFPGKVSSLDALCTAAHWIADSLDASLREHTEQIGASYDFIITGATKQNGLLFNRASQLLPPHSPRSLVDYGFLEDSFDAVAVAMLGILFMSNNSAIQSSLTSSPHDRLLGRLTPGSPEAWNRARAALAANL